MSSANEKMQASREIMEPATLEAVQAQIWGELTMLSFALKETKDPVHPKRYVIYEGHREARRVMKMASAISLIAARRPVWQDVSAASLELQYNRLGQPFPHELVIRVSQNGIMSVAALQGLNNLLGKILGFAGGKGRQWKSLQMRQDTTGDAGRAQHRIVHEFVRHYLLRDIVSYCFDKLLKIVSNRFKVFLACWETIKDHSPNIAEKFGEYLGVIIATIEVLFENPAMSRVKRVDCLAIAISSSVALLRKPDILEMDDAWKAAIGGASSPLSTDTTNFEDEEFEDGENDDDTISGNGEVTSATCMVIRFLENLARYFNVGFSLVTGILRQLARVPNMTIRILTVEQTVQEVLCTIGQTQAASLGILDEDGESLRKELNVPLLDEQSSYPEEIPDTSGLHTKIA